MGYNDCSLAVAVDVKLDPAQDAAFGKARFAGKKNLPLTEALFHQQPLALVSIQLGCVDKITDHPEAEDVDLLFFIFCHFNSSFDELYEKMLLDKTRFFDEYLELQFYELWHHEGRRARMGTMMMAPDYAWWHGFYECKSRFNEFMEEAEHAIKNNQKAYVYPNYPNATGNTTKPKEVFAEEKN